MLTLVSYCNSISAHLGKRQFHRHDCRRSDEDKTRHPGQLLFIILVYIDRHYKSD